MLKLCFLTKQLHYVHNIFTSIKLCTSELYQIYDILSIHYFELPIFVLLYDLDFVGILG